jgi:hypothetical protein
MNEPKKKRKKKLRPSAGLCYTETTSRMGFGCPGIRAFAVPEGGLYLSSNINPPSGTAKSRRRLCQIPILEVASVYHRYLLWKKKVLS